MMATKTIRMPKRIIRPLGVAVAFFNFVFIAFMGSAIIIGQRLTTFAGIIPNL
jgi:hypothetical protein